MNLEELKRLLAEATQGPWDFFQDHMTIRLTSKNREGRTIVGVSGRYADSVSQTAADFRLMAAAVNALPELIAIAELAGANAFESLSMAYAAGRADQRKADAEISRDYGGRNPPDGYATREGIAKAIEEQGNAPQDT